METHEIFPYLERETLLLRQLIDHCANTRSKMERTVDTSSIDVRVTQYINAAQSIRKQHDEIAQELIRETKEKELIEKLTNLLSEVSKDFYITLGQGQTIFREGKLVIGVQKKKRL